MISGYCQCSYPAIHVCKICGAKLCNNCYQTHHCEQKEPDQPLLIESEAVKTYTKKPGRPAKTK